MRYIHWLLCAAIISFFAGLVYATQFNRPVEKPGQMPTVDLVNKPFTVSSVPDSEVDNTLPDCSKVNTMPCNAVENDPVKNALDEQTATGDGLFKVGQEVTCIYSGIFWWDNRDEFVKTVPMVCKVIAASEEFTDIAPNYQHIRVDCSKDLATKWSDQPGAGMVKGHKLNYVKRWFSSDECYHFVQH